MRKSLIIAAALLLPAVSQAKTLEELLVEKGVITKAEASGATSSPGSKVYWKDGTRFEFPDHGFTSGFATQLQERYSFIDNPEDAGLENRSSFETIRARLDITGTALHNEFAYRLQPDFAGDEGARLKDVYIQWNACDWAQAKMGQFKTFLSRQWNTSDWKLQFPNRSLASEAFDLGRQHGLGSEWFTEDKMLVARAGIFNGNSEGEGENKPGLDTDMLGILALRVNPIGKIDAYTESDLDYTEDFALTSGFAYTYGDNKRAVDDEGPEDKFRDQRINLDAMMKWQGLSIAAEYYYADIKNDDAGGTVNPSGFYAQAGYFLMPKKFEVAARYSYLDCDNGEGCSGGVFGGDEGLDNVNEVSASLNYYFWKHNLKAQLAWTLQNEDFVDAEQGDQNTNIWMFQVSSYF